MTAQPCHAPRSSLARLWPLEMHGKKPHIAAQGLASFILQAGETLPATEQSPPHKTPEVTFDVTEWKRWRRGTQEGITPQLFNLACGLVLRKRQYFKQTWVLFVQ